MVSFEAVISSEVVINHPSVLCSGAVDFLVMGIQAVNTCSFGGNLSDELPALNAILATVVINIYNVVNLKLTEHMQWLLLGLMYGTLNQYVIKTLIEQLYFECICKTKTSDIVLLIKQMLF